MKPYPRYKPTGLDWLPSVPEHWEVVKIGRLFRLFLGKMLANSPSSPEDTFERYACAKDVHFSGVDTSDLKEMWFSPKEKDLYQTKLGDLLVVEGGAGAGGAAIVENEDGFYIQNSLHLLRPKSERGSARFLKYWIYSIVSRGYIPYICNKATIPHFTKEKVFYTSMPVPPPTEQDRIVRYLDEKTVAIDDLVRAKEREIDLLRELIVWHAEDAMRTAPKARFRLKRFVRQIAEEITVEPAREYHPLGVLNRGRGLFHKEPVLGADLGDSTFFHVHPGDMIISGQFAWEGAVAMLEESERGCVASHRYPLVRSSSDDLRLEYLWAFFQTHYGDMVLNLHSHGAAGRNRPLNFGELLDEYVPVPYLDRQAKIVDLVQKLSLVRRTAKTFKDRMAELRTRLVSDAVTGAVEV